MSQKHTDDGLEDLFADDEDGLGALFSEDPEPTAKQKFLSAAVEQYSIEGILQYINSRSYWIRQVHEVGHHTYPQGLWKICRIRKQEGYTIEGDFLRWIDQTQLQEMVGVYRAGMVDELEGLIIGAGVKDGPVRVGKPPIDPFGNIVIESSRGDYGPLPAECEWIENHDDVFVEYAGSDDNWPTGCWVVQGKGEDQYLDDTQLKYVAHDILGMPKGNKPRKMAVIQQNGDGSRTMLRNDFDPLFGLEEVFGDPADNEDLSALFEGQDDLAGLFA